MTEETPNDDRAQAEHRAKFAQGQKNLMKLFDAMLVSAPDLLSPQDVALIIYGSSIKALIAAHGVEGGLATMRYMVAGIEQTGALPTMQ